MPPATRFILNDREVETVAPAGLLVLDFLRNCERLTGTKEGCKEGDCGACAILIGELEGDAVRYQPVTSCLVPQAEVHGKHVVTIEGATWPGSTRCRRRSSSSAAPVRVLHARHRRVAARSAAGQRQGLSLDDVKYALSGHLCRCTGYRSLKDCAATLERDLGSRLQANGSNRPRAGADRGGALPEYFTTIPERLRALQAASPAAASIADGTAPSAPQPSMAASVLPAVADAADPRPPAPELLIAGRHRPLRPAGRDDP